MQEPTEGKKLYSGWVNPGNEPSHIWSKSLLRVLIFLTSISPLSAQLSDIHFENIRVIDGLSSNFAISIAQDKYGFMWFGTNNGLNRYDGHTVTTFWHEPKGSTSLSWNWVESLLLDREGNLWIGAHGGGLNLFNYDTETFSSYRHNPEDSLSLSNDVITVLYEDREQTLWVGTAYGGLNRLDRQTGTFKRYRHQENNPQSLSDDNVRRIYEDRSGTLWIGTGGPWVSKVGGLNRFDKNTETFTRYFPDPDNEQALMDNRVWGLYEDEAGTFWVGSWGDGLHQMDRERGIFTRLKNDPQRPQQLSSPYLRRGDPTDPGFGQGITNIFKDQSGIMWITAVYGGLDRFDPKTSERKHYEANKNIPNTVGLNWPWSIFEDRQNTIWLASAGNGIYKALPGAFQHFQHPTRELSIQAVFEDSRKVLWIGTDKGLFQLDETGQSLAAVPDRLPVFNRLAQESIQAIREDRKGNLWFGTTNGLYQLNATSGKVKRYQNRAGFPHSISHNQIIALVGPVEEDPALWIISKDNVLHRYDELKDQFTRYSFLDSMEIAPSIGSMSRGPNGKLWMGMAGGGAFRWDPGTETVDYFPKIFSWAYAYHEDRKGRFWIGSRLNGLIQFDPSQDSILQWFTEKEGLASGRINGILEDESGFLWLSTQEGYLSRFDPEIGVIKN